VNKTSSIPVLALMILLASCKVSENTSMAWVVSTFAGDGSTVQFNQPYGVAVDSEGNVYVADSYNHRIRKITPVGVVSTLAGGGISGDASGNTDGIGAAARFNYPSGVAVDSEGNVYVADTENHRIRKITPAGVVTTFAGTGTLGHTDGSGTAAQFNYLSGVAVDSEGNVYVADNGNHRIRKITPADRIEDRTVSTFAGDGTEGFVDSTDTDSAARFNSPVGVAVDSRGNVYVADSNNNCIRKITPAGVVSTFAGSTKGRTDGTGTEAQFNLPHSVAVDSEGNVYVADGFNHLIRKITPADRIEDRVVSTFAGSEWGYTDAIGTAARFKLPYSVAVDSSDNVYVADRVNNRIRKIEYKVP